MELAALVKGVSRFLAHLTIETDRAVNVNWKELRLSGQTDLVDLIRRVGAPQSSYPVSPNHLQIRAATFEIAGWASVPVGLCVSPQIARFNHSCRPNAYVAFPYGTDVKDPMRVIAINPRFGGEEVRPHHGYADD